MDDANEIMKTWTLALPFQIQAEMQQLFGLRLERAATCKIEDVAKYSQSVIQKALQSGKEITSEQLGFSIFNPVCLSPTTFANLAYVAMNSTHPEERNAASNMFCQLQELYASKPTLFVHLSDDVFA